MSVIYAILSFCFAGIVFILLYEDNHRAVLVVNKNQFKRKLLWAVKNSKKTPATYRKRNR